MGVENTHDCGFFRGDYGNRNHDLFSLCNCRGRHFKDVHEAQCRTLVLSLEAASAGTGTKSVGSNLSCSPHVQCLVSDSAEATQAAREGQAPPCYQDREGDEAKEPESEVHRGQVTGLVDERQDKPGDRSCESG